MPGLKLREADRCSGALTRPRRRPVLQGAGQTVQPGVVGLLAVGFPRLGHPSLGNVKPRHHHTPTASGEFAASPSTTQPSQRAPTTTAITHSRTLTNTRDHAHFAKQLLTPRSTDSL